MKKFISFLVTAFVLYHTSLAQFPGGGGGGGGDRGGNRGGGFPGMMGQQQQQQQPQEVFKGTGKIQGIVIDSVTSASRSPFRISPIWG